MSGFLRALIAATCFVTAAHAQVIPNGPITPSASAALSPANNLSDVPSPSTALANLGAVASSTVGAANGVASLDATGNLPLSQLGNTFTGLSNRIINGDFIRDSYNAGSTVTPGNAAFIADRWVTVTTQSSKFTSQGLLTTSPPDIARYYEKITSASAYTVLSTDQFLIEQKVEGPNIYDFQWASANGKSIQVAEWFKSSIAGPFCIALRDNGRTFSYVHQFAYTSTGTWQLVQFTVPAPASGAGWLQNAGGTGLRVDQDLGSGSTFQTTADAWQSGNFTSTAACTQLVASNAATYQYTNVRVYPASSPVPYVPRQIGEEARLAQYYYWNDFPPGTAAGQNKGVAGAACLTNPIATGIVSTYIRVPQMAKTPTVTTYNPSATNANWRDVTAAADSAVTVDPSTAVGPTGVEIKSAAVTNAGDDLCIHVALNAEI